MDVDTDRSTECLGEHSELPSCSKALCERTIAAMMPNKYHQIPSETYPIADNI